MPLLCGMKKKIQCQSRLTAPRTPGNYKNLAGDQACDQGIEPMKRSLDPSSPFALQVFERGNPTFD
ncbi:hypothetical protein JCM16814_30030 [Desulfobaculum senezii]